MADVPAANCVTSCQDIRDGVESGILLVIDVRNPAELVGGKIAAKRWMNIPIGEFEEAFGLPDGDFAKKYGGQKPAIDAEDIVINCGTGKRSAMALGMLLKMGYSKARHYVGGYNLWKTEIAK